MVFTPQPITKTSEQSVSVSDFILSPDTLFFEGNNPPLYIRPDAYGLTYNASALNLAPLYPVDGYKLIAFDGVTQTLYESGTVDPGNLSFNLCLVNGQFAGAYPVGALGQYMFVETTSGPGGLLSQELVNIGILDAIGDQSTAFPWDDLGTGIITWQWRNNGGLYEVYFNRFNSAGGTSFLGVVFDNFAEFDLAGLNQANCYMKFFSDKWLIPTLGLGGVIVIDPFGPSDKLSFVFDDANLDANLMGCAGVTNNRIIYDGEALDGRFFYLTVNLSLSTYDLIYVDYGVFAPNSIGLNPATNELILLVSNGPLTGFASLVPTSPIVTNGPVLYNSLKIGDGMKLPCYNPCTPYALKRI